MNKNPHISKWRIAQKTLPIVVGIVCVKYLIHFFGYEFLTLNSLFTALISANIFLIGFLVSGTLTDYKESEKLPADISSGLETLADEALIIYSAKKSLNAKDFLYKLSNLSSLIIAWFYKKEKTEHVLSIIKSFNENFLAFESETQANFIVRLKQEQNILRKTVKRIHTIRETSFLQTGYAITEIITCILVAGLVFVKMSPFYESIFFVSFVSFILIYMIFLIKDLDNPFGYSEIESLTEEVSLKPVLDTSIKLKAYYQELEK